MSRAWCLPIIALAVVGCQPARSDKPYQPHLRITPELCERVRAGMTKQEAELAIGGPPGFYEDTFGISYDPNVPGPRSKKGDQEWTGRQGTVEVTFDDQGKAINAGWYPAQKSWHH